MIILTKGLFEGTGVLTQKFGENPASYASFGLLGHNGIDYGIPSGTKLFSCIDGTVTEKAYDQYGYGNYIKIENSSCGVIYAHFKALSPLKVDTTVRVGDYIGLSGNTGNSTGPHLHFGVFPVPRDRGNGYNGYIDPLNKMMVNWVDAQPSQEPPVSGTELTKALADLKVCEDNRKTMTTLLETEMTTRKELEVKVKEKTELIDTLREELNKNKPISEYTLKELLEAIYRRVVGK